MNLEIRWSKGNDSSTKTYPDIKSEQNSVQGILDPL